MKTTQLPEETLLIVDTILQPYHLSVKDLLNDKKEERETGRKRFLSVKEAQEIYSVSRHTLFRWAKAGMIKSVKCSPAKSGKVLLEINSLEKFMQEHSE